MNFEIKKLTPDLAEDYMHFFDVTPHDDLVDEHKCYCVCWYSEDCIGDYEANHLSSREKRRAHAAACVKNGSIQGYLAYQSDKVVGWCNANTKSNCLCCYGWRRSMGYVPTEKAGSDIKVKSVFCFMIAPEMQRKGVATQLLERACSDASDEGFDFIEAYPYIDASVQSFDDFCGYLGMYKKHGFEKYAESDGKVVVRKALK